MKKTIMPRSLLRRLIQNWAAPVGCGLRLSKKLAIWGGSIKVLIVLLILALSASLAACGGGSGSSSGGARASSSVSSGASTSVPPNSSANNQSGSATSEDSMELTDFADRFMEVLGTTSGRFEAPLNGSDVSPFYLMDLNNATMTIGLFATYDMVEVLREAGMPVTVGSFREANGNVITFGEDYVREEDG